MAAKPRKTPASAATTPVEPVKPATVPAVLIDLGTADPATIAARAKDIGVAQAALNDAVAAAAAAQLAVKQAVSVDVEPALQAFDDACDNVLVAREAFYQLIGLDLGHEILPPSEANDEEAAQSSDDILPSVEPERPHTHDDDDDDDGEVGNGADLTDEDADRVVAYEVARLATSVRKRALADPVAALAHLAEERRKAQLMMSMAKQVDAALAALELEVVRTETVWPLTTIRFGGAEQPIGEALKVDLATFVSLTTSGAAADHAPKTTTSEEL